MIDPTHICLSDTPSQVNFSVVGLSFCVQGIYPCLSLDFNAHGTKEILKGTAKMFMHINISKESVDLRKISKLYDSNQGNVLLPVLSDLVYPSEKLIVHWDLFSFGKNPCFALVCLFYEIDRFSRRRIHMKQALGFQGEKGAFPFLPSCLCKSPVQAFDLMENNLSLWNRKIAFLKRADNSSERECLFLFALL